MIYIIHQDLGYEESWFLVPADSEEKAKRIFLDELFRRYQIRYKLKTIKSVRPYSTGIELVTSIYHGD